MAGERRPSLHQLGMWGQHLEDVEDLAGDGVFLDALAGMTISLDPL